jgi:hypothetical protein
MCRSSQLVSLSHFERAGTRNITSEPNHGEQYVEIKVPSLPDQFGGLEKPYLKMGMSVKGYLASAWSAFPPSGVLP